MNARITLKSLAAEVAEDRARTNAALDSIQATLAVLAEAVQARVVEPAPAPVVEPQPSAEEPNEFVTWLRDTAEARHARKACNREMAAWLREKGFQPTGAVWAAAKQGNRSVRSLRAIARKAGETYAA